MSAPTDDEFKASIAYFSFYKDEPRRYVSYDEARFKTLLPDLHKAWEDWAEAEKTFKETARKYLYGHDPSV